MPDPLPRPPASLIGRADLLRLLKVLGPDALAEAAVGLGYRRVDNLPCAVVETPPILAVGRAVAQLETRVLPAPTAPPSVARYWTLVRREPRQPEQAAIQPPPWYDPNLPPIGDDTDPDWRPPPFQPLLPWPRLGPWLRRRLGDERPGKEPDMGRVTTALAAGRPLRRLPLRLRTGWAPRIALLLGHAPHLWTYREDFNQVWRRLRSLRGRGPVDVWTLAGTPSERPRVRAQGQVLDQPWQPPAPGVPLLILGDLGLLDPDPTAREGWIRFGRALRREGLAAVALCPVPAARVPTELARCFDIHEWDPGARLAFPVRPGQEVADEDTAPLLESLLTLLAPALRTDASLLRGLRRDLGGHAVLEADLQRHADVARDGDGLVFAGDEARRRRRLAFAQLPARQLRRVARQLQAHHGHTPSLAMAERGLVELASRSLPAAQQDTVLSAQERDALRDYRLRLLRRADSQPDVFFLRCWLPGHLDQQAEAVQQEPALRALWSVARRPTLQTDGRLDLPEWADDPELRYFLETDPVTSRPCVLRQRGETLELAETVWHRPATGVDLVESQFIGSQVTVTVAGSAPQRLPAFATPLVRLTRGMERLTLDLGSEVFHLAVLAKPAWAASIRRDARGLGVELPVAEGRTAWLRWLVPTDGGEGYWLADGPLAGWREPGPIREDGFGLYAEFSVGGVTQRCRWIAPGTFLMGSPESAEGRYNDESPQHEVVLTGFWMADTACTQALWQAVMGKNPSWDQRDPNNPVETVSWGDCRGFFEKLNTLVPGLAAGFPSEAQWEYACRAGTTTAYYFGERITLGQVNYGRRRERVVPVASLPANPWGLYEMHGNVFEWCADWHGPYVAASQTDPEQPALGLFRVLRGGSWFDRARDVRSAYRLDTGPDLHSAYVGLRVAPGRAGQAESMGASRAGRAGGAPGSAGGPEPTEEGRARGTSVFHGVEPEILNADPSAYTRHVESVLSPKAEKKKWQATREALLRKKGKKPWS